MLSRVHAADGWASCCQLVHLGLVGGPGQGLARMLVATQTAGAARLLGAGCVFPEAHASAHPLPSGLQALRWRPHFSTACQQPANPPKTLPCHLVQLADEAVCIGEAPSSESYLSIPSIISAAISRGADAIHPVSCRRISRPRHAAAAVLPLLCCCRCGNCHLCRAAWWQVPGQLC